MTLQPATEAGVRYAIYARTASGGQVAADGQEQRARAAIARRGDGEIVAAHRDINISRNHAPGLGLTALLGEVARGRIDAVVVTDLTRLGRSWEQASKILAALKRGSARLVMAGADG